MNKSPGKQGLGLNIILFQTLYVMILQVKCQGDKERKYTMSTDDQNNSMGLENKVKQYQNKECLRHLLHQAEIK